jgi:hypothetical protein
VNQDVKKLWVEELRSGRYTQAVGHLYHPLEGFCCLGVLTDVYLRESGICVDHAALEYEEVIENNSHNRLNEIPSVEILIWAGLEQRNCADLAQMNDDGEEFPTIAQRIEETL